jgi:hypothetical protein
MKNLNPRLFSFAKVYCNIFGHTLKVSKNVTNHIHEYECAKCGMEMTDTANGLIARLTPKFKETNNYLAKIHQRRRRRLQPGS